MHYVGTRTDQSLMWGSVKLWSTTLCFVRIWVIGWGTVNEWLGNEGKWQFCAFLLLFSSWNCLIFKYPFFDLLCILPWMEEFDFWSCLLKLYIMQYIVWQLIFQLSGVWRLANVCKDVLDVEFQNAYRWRWRCNCCNLPTWS